MLDLSAAEKVRVEADTDLPCSKTDDDDFVFKSTKREQSTFYQHFFKLKSKILQSTQDK